MMKYVPVVTVVTIIFLLWVGVNQQKSDGHVKSDKELICVEKNSNSQFHVLFLTQYVR